MLEYLRTRAQMASFNKGWKGKVKLYEEIAIDPENIIAGAELLCLIDEGGGSLVEGANCTIRETLDAVRISLSPTPLINTSRHDLRS